MAYIGKEPIAGNFQMCDAISVVNGQAAYTMQVGGVNVAPETALNTIVSLNGTIQKANSSYTISNSVITFSSNLVTNDVIDFILILGDVLSIGTPSDGTVTNAKLSSGSFSNITETGTLTNFTSTGIDDNADATAITIDSSERVGIQATSPVTTLDVGGSLSGGQGVVGKEMLISQTLDTTYAGGTSGSWGGLMLNNNNSATDNRTATGLHFTHGTSGVAGIVSTSTTSQRADIRFITRGAGDTVAERVRIDDDGRLLVGTATPYSSNNQSSIHINVDGVGSGAGAIMSECSGTGTIFHQHYRNGNGGVGGISTNGSSTSFVTSSDYRLKENVLEMTNATDRLKKLKPKRFNFKTDANTTVDGFLAHEVSSVVPEAITGEKDGMAIESRYTTDDVETQGETPSKNVGDPKTYSTTEINAQGIDQSKLVPLLVKTIQELEARITELENA